MLAPADHFSVLQPSPRRGLRGFTLLELLVVVAIVAVLAALLLPALSRSKAGAHQLQCSNNLRQLAIIARMYQVDASGRGLFPAGDTAVWLDPLVRYYPKVDALRLCPGAPEKSPSPQVTTAGNATTAWTWVDGETRYSSSYGLNGWLYASDGNGGGPADRLSYFDSENQITRPTSTPFFLDCIRPTLWARANDALPKDLTTGNDGSRGIGRSAVARHGDRSSADTATINVVCIDGHVEKASISSLLTRFHWHQNYPGPNRAQH